MVETYIVTPNYNGLVFLKEYFESLEIQTYADFKIVFVDNSNDNDSIDYIKTNYENIFSNKLIIIKNNENFGFAKATNIGIKESKKDNNCKYIVCLNNDVKLFPDFLEKLIKCAENHSEAGSIQSKMIFGYNSNYINSVGAEFSINGLGFSRGAYESVLLYNKEEEIIGTGAGASLYKLKALEDTKIDEEYFDESFFAYYEDTDLALRLRWAGWKSYYCPDAKIYHFVGGTNKAHSDFTVYHMGRNYTWTFFKNMPSNYIIKKFYLLILCEIAQILLNLSRGKLIIIKSKIDAYKNIRRILKKNNKIKKRIEFCELEQWFINKWRVKKIPIEISENF